MRTISQAVLRPARRSGPALAKEKPPMWQRHFSLWISVAMKPLHSSKPKVAGASRSQAVVAEQDKFSRLDIPVFFQRQFFSFFSCSTGRNAYVTFGPLPSSEKVRTLECSNMFELLKGRHVARWKAVTCHAHSKEMK